MNEQSPAAGPSPERGEEVRRAGKKPTYMFVLPWTLRSIGGVNEVVKGLYTSLDQGDSYQPMILFNVWEPPLQSDAAGRRAVYLPLHSPFDEARQLRALLGFLFHLPMSLWRLRRLVRDWEVEVVNVHYLGLSCVHFILLKKLGLFRGGLIFSVHGADMTAAENSSLIERSVWRLLITRADALVACSESLAARAVAFAPRARSSVHVIHNGIDIDQFLAPSHSSPHIPTHIEGRTVILNVATFEPKKGQDILVEAFQIVHKEHPETFLVMIGRSGPSVQALKEAIRARALEHSILMLYNVPHEHIAAWLKKASMFVLSSRVEPFGVSILEAGACRIPVIATSVGGIPEIVTDGQTALLVPSEDTLALSRAIIVLLEDSGRREQLADNLCRRVQDAFALRVAVEKYLRVCDALRMPVKEKPTSYDAATDLDHRIAAAMGSYLSGTLGRKAEEVRQLTALELSGALGSAVVADLDERGLSIQAKRILDLGAGLGNLSTELTRAGANVFTLEPQAFWAGIAVERISQTGVPRVIAAVGESLPLPGDVMDIVVSRFVLEHVQDPEAVLEEVFRVLKPGGFFMLSCENYLSFREPHYNVAWFPMLPKAVGVWYLRHRGRSPDFLVTSITYTTLPRVRKALRRCGFVTERDQQLRLLAKSPQRLKSHWKRLCLQLVWLFVPEEFLFRLLLASDLILNMFKSGVYECAWKPPVPGRV